MKVMILAAGRGERMRPLSDTTPKPLLKVGEHSLTEWHLLNLAQANFNEVVINVSYQAPAIMAALGNGHRYGVHIEYSLEPETGGLETGGGIYRALPLLGQDPFLIISADIWTDYRFNKMQRDLNGALAHCVMVDNPDYHPGGDFALRDGYLTTTGTPKLTYGNIALLHPDLFADAKPGKFPLAPLLKAAMKKHLVTGEYFSDQWVNVGSPDILAKLRQHLV